jgi:hypothetical protein
MRSSGMPYPKVGLSLEKMLLQRDSNTPKQMLACLPERGMVTQLNLALL